MKTNRIAPKILLLGSLLCALPAPSQAERRVIEGVPIAYIVATDRASFGDALSRLTEEEYEFDGTLRQPTRDKRPIPVDCATTHSIGVVYALTVSDPPPDQPITNPFFADGKVRVNYAWKHSELDFWRLYLDDHHWVSFARRGNMAVDAERLRLREELRVDGLLQLTASIKGEPVFNATFELTGCATPDRG